MRPQHLSMEGFLAYRHRTDVDFGDADLFVLSGPTGSGKSSVIDGMTFALYGTIPRLDDRRSVSPVISARADRARVSFRFTVGDEVYTAVRLVERRGAGATTTEARLLRGDDEEVLAGTADEVTAEVTRLLGLSYDHFTKAVVLPQGAFADFLNDRPKDRQALLRALLELGLYEQVMQLANLRARTAEAKAESIREGLEKLDVPGPEQVAEAREHLALLVEAAEEMPSRVEELEMVTRKAEEVAAAGTALEGVLSRLTAITAPADLETLIDDRASAMERLAVSLEAQGEVIAARDELASALAGYPERQVLERWHGDRQRLAVLSANRVALGLERLAELADETTAARDQARARLEETRVQHAAHRLRRGLEAGGTCPVCHGVVTTIPAGDPGDAASLDRLGEEALELESAAAEARDRLKEAEGQVKQIDQAIAELEESLLDAPPEDEVEAALGALTSLLASHEEIMRSEASAGEAVKEAEAAVSRLEERTAALREALLTARDAVVDEGPPLPGDDVIAGWHVFETWRADRIIERRAELEGLATVIEESRLAVSEARSALASWLAGLGVEAAGSPSTDLALAIERRSTEVRDLEKTLADAVEMKAELDLETGRARVASALGTHLRANNFEAWLLEEAMEVLIDGANRLLGELSGGSYSLRVKDSQFEVVDHRNARLTRTTRSLSGGEIFLVALSLALSMADQLAALTGMSSRLESVFLDEGFGSLDQESLDVVASV
ncbi:MAG TPA: SMC family ATPase, partial [Acidimicrobiia bacterium]